MQTINNISIDIPPKWQTEENGDSVSIYDINGHGAVTMSFYKIIDIDDPIVEYISKKSVEFLNQNKIKLDKSLIIDASTSERIILSGTGKDIDNWIVKLFVLTDGNSIVMVTYHTDKETSEIKVVNKMVNSIIII